MNININDYLNASEIILINFFTEYNINIIFIYIIIIFEIKYKITYFIVYY